jgi:hypothetical protein
MTEEQFTQLLLDIGEIKRSVKDDHKAIRGNGQPGLLDRMKAVETKVAVGVWGIRALCAVIGFVGGKILDVIAQRLAG